jgi:hypothetical protein
MVVGDVGAALVAARHRATTRVAPTETLRGTIYAPYKKLGTFQIPVDSFNETPGGGRMVIETSNRADSSPSTTNQRPNDEIYETT